MATIKITLEHSKGTTFEKDAEVCQGDLASGHMPRSLNTYDLLAWASRAWQKGKLIKDRQGPAEAPMDYRLM